LIFDKWFESIVAKDFHELFPADFADDTNIFPQMTQNNPRLQPLLLTIVIGI
jgi:hypothetical protein